MSARAQQVTNRIALIVLGFATIVWSVLFILHNTRYCQPWEGLTTFCAYGPNSDLGEEFLEVLCLAVLTGVVFGALCIAFVHFYTYVLSKWWHAPVMHR